MLRVFDFTCASCGHTFEQFVETDQRTDTCPKCEGTANRIISPVRFKLDPVSGDFPTATDRWIKMHEKHGGSTPDES